MSHSHLTQNRYFNANCIILGSFAVVIFPNNGLLNAEIGSFIRKEFVTLKASARSSNFFVSWIWNVRERAASSPHQPGPETLFAPTLPYVPGAACLKAKG